MMNKCKLINPTYPEDGAGNCYEATHWCHFFCWWNKHSLSNSSLFWYSVSCLWSCTKTIYYSEKKKKDECSFTPQGIIYEKCYCLAFIAALFNFLSVK